MSNLKFDDLTIEQLHYISNGCGTWFLDIPDLLFTAACDRHDFGYWIGCTEEDRKVADWDFYLNIKIIVSDLPWYKRWWYTGLAWVYYKAVRLFGSSTFYYGPSKKTLEDLEEEMRNA